MLIYLSSYSLLMAITIDALIGDPKWFYKIIPHPVEIMGKFIAYYEKIYNRKEDSPSKSVIVGSVFTVISVSLLFALSAYLTLKFKDHDYFWFYEAILIAILLSQNSLYLHVYEIYKKLIHNDIEASQRALSNIVSREVSQMDESEISRSSIESLAENYSDAIIAPLFWACVFGLPGIITYKYINTLDSMIGYKNDKYLHFGKFAARLDDVVNFIPARLSTIPLIISSLFIKEANIINALKVISNDASKHKSPNAGYPESAYAGILNIKLAGPRIYDGIKITDPYIGIGKQTLNKDDISLALKLYIISLFINLIIIYLYLLTSIDMPLA